MDNCIKERICKEWWKNVNEIIDSLTENRRLYMHQVSRNQSITWRIIKKNKLLRYEWDWKCLTMNPSITYKQIVNNPEYDWNWKLIKEKYLYTCENIDKYLDLNGVIPLPMYENPNLTKKHFKKYFNKKNTHENTYKNHMHNAYYYSMIKFKKIPKNISQNWHWSKLSSSPSITWSFVNKFKSCSWDWRKLSHNPAITWNDISKNINEQWDWHYVSNNPSITWEIVKENLDKPWNWHFLLINPSITWKTVKENLDKPWNTMTHAYIDNPSLTWKTAKKLCNSNTIDGVQRLISNPMNYKRKEKIQKIKDLILYKITQSINYKIEL